MKAYILSLNKEADLTEQWDYGILYNLIKDDFEIEKTKYLPNCEKALVAIPARHHEGLEREINNELKHIEQVVLFLMGDEEADFNIEKIQHPNIHIWVQNPHPDKHDKYDKIGTGYPKHLKDNMPEKSPLKFIDVFFSGQITHNRRDDLANIMEYYIMEMKGNAILNKTNGFTQGLKPPEYYSYMVRTKLAPCPSGAVIPDSFRLFEALECMAIPIADDVNPDKTITSGYWDFLFGEITPFPKVNDWDRLTGLIKEILDDYPRNLHQITCWWIMYKRNLKNKIKEQLK